MQFDDPREVPAYGIPEAAHYLQIPVTTLRSWVLGQDYKIEGGKRKRRFRPVISLPTKGVSLLSFFNLAEAHVLRAIRTQHNISLKHIRAALEFVDKKFDWKRPLIQQEFKTDGAAIFVEHLGELIDVSADGQTVMREVVEAHLERLTWENQLAARLYPFTRARELDGPKCVFIDPRFAFGRPILAKSRIATAVIAERYKAGDSVDILAEDYGCQRLDIEEGLRCELEIRTAA